ncbi:MAG: amidohydrolase [Deltaproteobacteria bacterium]|nr:amidohydrolase [Deltaproteobacteria bacterium]
MNLLIKGIIVTPQDAIDGYVGIKGSQIVYVGKEKKKAKKTIEDPHLLIIPGLINTHTHLAMSLFRGLVDDLKLKDWLYNYIFPLEKKFINKNSVYWCSLLSMVELVRGGVTTFVDMYFFEDEVARACKNIGMRGFIGEGILDFPTPDAKNSDQSIEKTKELLEKFKEDKLISIIVAPHSTYTVERKTLERCKQLSLDKEMLFNIHAAETKDEIKIVKEKTGKTPIKYLNDIHILDEYTILAHCTHVTDQEIEMLKEKRSTVCCVPESNMKLASGIAPVWKMIKNNVNVTIGTDGSASNNNLDLFQEMDTISKVQKLYTMDSTAMDAKNTLFLATANSGKALHKKIGKIEEGYIADLAIIDLNDINLIPYFNPYSHLIYSASASNVKMTIINGKIIYENGRMVTVDEEEIKQKVREIASKVAKG